MGRAQRAFSGEPDPTGRHSVFQTVQHTPVHCDITRFALEDANQALAHLRSGQFNGAIVLTP